MKVVKTLPLFEALKTLQIPGLQENLFSSPQWFNVIRTAYHPCLFFKYIETDGVIRSHIVYTVVRNFLEWKICVLSYSDYCDAFVLTAQDWKLLFDSLRRDYPEYRIALRTFRDIAARASGLFQELNREYVHVLDLSSDIDTLWKGLEGGFRNQVRQGERRGLVCREGTRADLWSFYLLHVSLRKRKYHIFAQPFSFFQALWEEFIDSGNGFLLCSFDPAGRMVGGNIFLVHNKTLYYKVNTSSAPALELRSNNVLMWEGIKRAKQRGLTALDLGSSGREQDGLVHFKDGTGAVRSEIIHLGYHPPGYVFSRKRILKAYTRLMTQSWVPDAVTRAGSHLIYPFLA